MGNNRADDFAVDSERVGVLLKMCVSKSTMQRLQRALNSKLLPVHVTFFVAYFSFVLGVSGYL